MFDCQFLLIKSHHFNSFANETNNMTEAEIFAKYGTPSEEG
jgi:hypothetical protein